MPERLSEELQKRLSARLSFYQDVGIREFYRLRNLPLSNISGSTTDKTFATPGTPEGDDIPKIAAIKSLRSDSQVADQFAKGSKTGFISGIPALGEGTLLTVREDIGDCIRCKLHRGRTNIVFGDGHPQAKLLFIGEGPGRDEDLQGLPFVGRAGKLLTQMIEAMGLQRSDVYICNVVKCRPPENRAPEKDEVAACSPFLIRQVDLVAPQVIVTLGSIAVQTVLDTARGISALRGKWMEFRGRKLMPTYHPAYLLRNPAAKSEVWKDLQLVMAELGLEVRKGKPAQA